MGRFSEDVKIVTAITTTNGAAGTTAINGAGCDTSGFDEGACVVTFGAIVSGAATSIKLQQSDDDGSSDSYGDVEGTSQTVADDADGEHFVIDFKRPTKRYVRVVVSRATQNATVGAANYYLSGAGNRPVTQPADVNVERFTSAAEGTA